MPTNRPNIVLILTDDQGYWAMGCAGNSDIHTPNLDRLAAEGMRFTSFFCASPVCSPARASILTGMIPSQHGVHDWIRGGNTASDSYNKRPVEYLSGCESYSQRLVDAGYTCGMTGKWHLGDSMNPQQGFSHWHIIERGGSHYYDATIIENSVAAVKPGYLTDVVTDDAVEYIQAQSQTDDPFYLSVHYTAPHSPWGQKQHPPEVWAEYEDCTFEATPNEPVHEWQIDSCEADYNQSERKRLLRGYYTAITALDRGVGKIMDTLDALGLRENTLLIFTSDNGMNMGHHGIWGKGNGTYPQNMFDTSVKVPMLMSKPGEIPAGVINDDMLSHYDLKPTLEAYVGLDASTQNLPGSSFLPVLHGESLDEDRPVVIYDEYGPVRMIRTREYKYIARYAEGPNELYDLLNDPGEITNCIDDADLAPVVASMKTKLEAWFEQYTLPHLDGRKQKVYGKGQFDRIRENPTDKTFADDWRYTAKLYNAGAKVLKLFGKK